MESHHHSGSSIPAHRRVARIDSSACTHCRACVKVCPQGAIVEPVNYSCAKCVKYCSSMPIVCDVERVRILPEHCDGCGQCVLACPHDAIHWVER